MGPQQPVEKDFVHVVLVRSLREHEVASDLVDVTPTIVWSSRKVLTCVRTPRASSLDHDRHAVRSSGSVRTVSPVGLMTVIRRSRTSTATIVAPAVRSTAFRKRNSPGPSPIPPTVLMSSPDGSTQDSVLLRSSAMTREPPSSTNAA